MKIKFDKKEISKNIGIEFTNEKDYILYLQKLVEDLEKHNKNYRRDQYFKITEMREILDNLIINN